MANISANIGVSPPKAANIGTREYRGANIGEETREIVVNPIRVPITVPVTPATPVVEPATPEREKEPVPA